MNVKNFVESISSRKYLNNAMENVESNFTALLRRMAAYKEAPKLGGNVSIE